MSHERIRTETRLHLLRASSRLREAARYLDDALDSFETGEPWDQAATESRINAHVAQVDISLARGMAEAAALAQHGTLFG